MKFDCYKNNSEYGKISDKCQSSNMKYMSKRKSNKYISVKYSSQWCLSKFTNNNTEVYSYDPYYSSYNIMHMFSLLSILLLMWAY